MVFTSDPLCPIQLCLPFKASLEGRNLFLLLEVKRKEKHALLMHISASNLFLIRHTNRRHIQNTSSSFWQHGCCPVGFRGWGARTSTAICHVFMFLRDTGESQKNSLIHQVISCQEVRRGHSQRGSKVSQHPHIYPRSLSLRLFLSHSRKYILVPKALLGSFSMKAGVYMVLLQFWGLNFFFFFLV